MSNFIKIGQTVAEMGTVVKMAAVCRLGFWKFHFFHSLDG